MVPTARGLHTRQREVGFCRFSPGHLLTHQVLQAAKVAQMAGFAVLTGSQKAQDKHGKECRGVHSKVVDRVDTPLLPMPFRIAVRMV